MTEPNRPIGHENPVTCTELVAFLQTRANPANVAGMARYGIRAAGTLGVSMPVLRELARSHRCDHRLAGELWATGIHEARILATLVDDPNQVTADQLESWARDIDSWDIGDQCCNNLFRRAAVAWTLAAQWQCRPEVFVKRAGFVLAACLAVHDKQAGDERFLATLANIRHEAGDDRNFVKKGVNWSLRQIGKRNEQLREAALACARELTCRTERSARWIGTDALRELVRLPRPATGRSSYP